MYEWATGHWLFSPEEHDGLPRDIVHLAQMTERTGQHHETAMLQHYGLGHGFQDLPELLAKGNKGVVPIVVMVRAILMKK